MTVADASQACHPCSMEAFWPAALARIGLQKSVTNEESPRQPGESWLAWGRRLGVSDADLLTAAAELLDVALVEDLRRFRSCPAFCRKISDSLRSTARGCRDVPRR